MKAASTGAEDNAVLLMRQHVMHYEEADENGDGELTYEEFVASVPPKVRNNTAPAQLCRLSGGMLQSLPCAGTAGQGALRACGDR